MDRRTSFLRIGYCLMALGLLAAACAGPSAGQAPQPVATAPSAPVPTAVPAPPSPKAEQPARGGILKPLLEDTPSDLDIQQNPSIRTSFAVGPAYNQLFDEDPQTGMQLVGSLVDTWDMSGDGLTWTFRLRDNVKFHDGTPFTADDAVWNLDRLTNPPKGFTSQIRNMMRPFGAIEKVDPLSFRIVLKYPYAPMMTVLAHPFASMLSKRFVESGGDYKTKEMGTGGFVLKSFTPGVNVILSHNSGYWKKDRPYVDGLEYSIIRDRATYLGALRTGRVDMTAPVFGALTAIEREDIRKNAPTLIVEPSASLIGPWIHFNTEQKPFNDFRVRKAISLATDRDAAIKIIAEGAGFPGTFILPPSFTLDEQQLRRLPGFGDKAKERAEAKQLLAEAGYPAGFQAAIVSRTTALSRTSSTFMTDQLAQVGIQTNVDIVEDGVFWPKVSKGDFGMANYTPVDLYGDPANQGNYMIYGQTLAIQRFNNVELLDLWDRQLRATDPTERLKILKLLETKLLTEWLPAVPLEYSKTFMAWSPRVGGYQVGRNDYTGNSFNDVWLRP